MNRLAHKQLNRALRSHRVRRVVHGTADRPRLCVRLSNLHVSAQIIDDSNDSTIAYVTTVGQKTIKGTMTEKATWAGGEIARAAKAKKIKRVVLDRGPKLYHGRIKALADAARQAGLEF